MKYRSKRVPGWTLVVVGACVALPVVAAQNRDTAAGAQRFLADMARKIATQVQFVDAEGRTNYVTGKYSGDVKTSKISNIARTKETFSQLPEQVVNLQLADVRVATLDAVDAEGRPNECATRITELTAPDYNVTKSDVRQDNKAFSYTMTYTNEQWQYEPLTKFTSPAQVIDWRYVRVSRSPESHITVTSRGQAFTKIHLTFVPGNLDLADRIEYAMRFLIESCNEAVDTGS